MNETYRILFQGDAYKVVGVEFREEDKDKDETKKRYHCWDIRGLKASTETELRTLVEEIYKGVKYNPHLIAHWITDGENNNGL